MPHINEKIDFAVEVFVVYKNKVLLRLHDKYKIWLSVGGHVDLDEDPNQTALREVKEEVGLDVSLYDKNLIFKYEEKGNRQLIPPIALGRHNISEMHEHVVFIYFATSNTDEVIPEKETDQWKWVGMEELDSMDLRPDIAFYAKEALIRLGSA
ncbi:MAG: NUDIX domain-containing protein [Candidatus Pacebacteria bacterium]|nr:NUDIX domain-containing protein [Candidatus Paceibacterota bacterium]MCF7863012.1 NUDIX domain-containing protein [Candidatus Paceibacterota bacterium]